MIDLVPRTLDMIAEYDSRMRIRDILPASETLAKKERGGRKIHPKRFLTQRALIKNGPFLHFSNKGEKNIFRPNAFAKMTKTEKKKKDV